MRSGTVIQKRFLYSLLLCNSCCFTSNCSNTWESAVMSIQTFFTLRYWCHGRNTSKNRSLMLRILRLDDVDLCVACRPSRCQDCGARNGNRSAASRVRNAPGKSQDHLRLAHQGTALLPVLRIITVFPYKPMRTVLLLVAHTYMHAFTLIPSLARFLFRGESVVF